MNAKTPTRRVVIIGGVAGGASAAARLRRMDEFAQITLVERGPDVSFANCGLPYHIGGEIADRERLAIQTPASLRSLLGIDVRALTEATHIDRESRTVTVVDRTSGQVSQLPYDRLILAPGVSAGPTATDSGSLAGSGLWSGSLASGIWSGPPPRRRSWVGEVWAMVAFRWPDRGGLPGRAGRGGGSTRRRLVFPGPSCPLDRSLRRCRVETGSTKRPKGAVVTSRPPSRAHKVYPRLQCSRP